MCSCIFLLKLCCCFLFWVLFLLLLLLSDECGSLSLYYNGVGGMNFVLLNCCILMFFLGKVILFSSLCCFGEVMFMMVIFSGLLNGYVVMSKKFLFYLVFGDVCVDNFCVLSCIFVNMFMWEWWLFLGWIKFCVVMMWYWS